MAAFPMNLVKLQALCLEEAKHHDDRLRGTKQPQDPVAKAHMRNVVQTLRNTATAIQDFLDATAHKV